MAPRPRKTDDAQKDQKQASTNDPQTDNISKRIREGLRRDQDAQVKKDQERRETIAKLARSFETAARSLSGEALEDLEMGLRLAHLLRRKSALVPAQPAKQYENRSDDSILAPQFIEANYEFLLDGTYSRSDLAMVDPSALAGLRGWEQRHGKLTLDQFNLPTVEQLNSQVIDSGLLECTLAKEVRRLTTVAAVRRTRDK